MLTIGRLLILSFCVSCVAEISKDDSAQGQKKESEDIKSFIINEYYKNDHKLFSKVEDCYFEAFVNNNLGTSDLDFEYYYEGFWYKYNYCYYLDFWFNIIKSPGGNYYYFGLTDEINYHKMFNENYDKPVKDYTLKDFGNESSFEMTVLNDLLDNEEEFIIDPQKRKDQQYLNDKLRLGISIIYNAYRKPNEGYTAYESIFDKFVLVSDLEAYLVNLKKGDSLSESEGRQILQKYNKFMSMHNNQMTYAYQYEDLGIMVFQVEYNVTNDQMIGKKNFITTFNSENVFLSTNDYFEKLSECENIIN